MKSQASRFLFLALSITLSFVPLSAQQTAPAEPGAPRPWGQNPNGMHVYLQAGLKTHFVGQHDYPQFLADWSKVLTEHGAIVDGSLHQPSASELEGVDVLVIYKGDDGYMSDSAKNALEAFVKRGGGMTVSTIRCAVRILPTSQAWWVEPKSMAR